MNALPSPKPTRLKRLALRFVVLAAAASVLFAAYWFTRPPELVWWTSPEIGKTRKHAHVLVPIGWKISLPAGPEEKNSDSYTSLYIFEPRDSRPVFLRWIFSEGGIEKDAEVGVFLYQSSVRDPGWNDAKGAMVDIQPPASARFAGRVVICRDVGIWALVDYIRNDHKAFKATQALICNSLRIE